MTVLLEYIGKFSCEDLITFLEEYPRKHIYAWPYAEVVLCDLQIFFLFEVEKSFLHTDNKKKKVWLHEINTEAL